MSNSVKVGIVDPDLLDGGTRHPNLALMKLSAYHKSIGNEVELLENYDNLGAYDKLYASKVFTKTEMPEGIIEQHGIEIGGSGFYEDGGDNLPEEIEHIMPDYDLYLDYVERELSEGRPRSRYADYLDYSIGFTTRGCFRKCEFCINKKYDRTQLHSPIEEFLDEDRKHIYLWDDNFLASPNWENILEELNATGKRFKFRQGLDIRLMTNKKAKALSESRYLEDFMFAFDHIEDKELIEEKLNSWRKHTDRETRLYVLVGYHGIGLEDIVSTLERIRILMKYDCFPYIMKYEDCVEKSEYGEMYRQLGRWCNQPSMFRTMSFRDFPDVDQRAIKTESFVCKSRRVLNEFEGKHPEIAAKYFDMKWKDYDTLKID